jgi:hypothetical protein
LESGKFEVYRTVASGLEMHTKFWSENLKERDDSEDLSAGGRIVLDWILGTYGEKLWNGFIWLRLGTSGGLL